MANNIFLIGLNQFNLDKLKNIRGADQNVYRGVLDPSEVYDTEVFPIADMLKRAERSIRESGVSVDAVAGYMDFPVSTMLPLLCAKFGTRTTSLESLLKCEHKYWSRVVQHEVIPDHIPKFTAFDPFDDDAMQTIGEAGLGFPFFVKPVKSSGSRLGFKIDSPEDFDEAIAKFRAEIGTIAEPFDFILQHAELPPDVARVSGQYCMAEEIIGGHQCTVEGYVHNGEVVPYGIVDSIRYPKVLSFFHYLYPSGLPAHVQERMEDLTKRLMRHTGFDNSAFNIEFFWDEPRDHLWLLEVNTRISQSHCDLFQKVDGVSHHQVTIDLALGRRPDMPHREGKYPVAAKFFHRVFFKDATVARAPTDREVEEVQAAFPGTYVAVQVEAGTRLSDLPEQDSYSYALAYIWTGAASHDALLRQYNAILDRLPFEFTDIEE